jgi:cytochrome b6-f complex iron-sulfur subunit
MATKEQVTRVWIEPGCIVCDACETTAPDVFEVTEDTCLIRPAALAAEFTKPRTQSIIDAAEECPVDVIKFETAVVEVSDAEAAAAPAAEAKPAAAAAAEPAKAKAHGEPKAAKPERAPEPAKAGKPEPVLASGQDPAIAALLRAATSRGGSAGIQRRAAEVPEVVDAMKRKDPRDLPPDARQARIIEAARKAKQDPDQSRRAFMSNAALATGWIAFGLGTGVAVGPAEPDPRVRVGKVQRYMEMAPGEVNEDYKPQGIWMVREEDRIAALNIICTHLGCIPNWLPNDRKFKCPCHGSGYKPNGINFEGPTPRPLERFRVVVEDGIVVVDKSKKFQFELGQWEMPGSYLAV